MQYWLHTNNTTNAEASGTSGVIFTCCILCCMCLQPCHKSLPAIQNVVQYTQYTQYSQYCSKRLAVLSLMCVCRLMSTAYELYWHRLPFLITDLTSQSTGYTTTQPCMDTLLYQIEHINQTVIALPSAMSVRPLLKLGPCLLSLRTCKT